jgi:hypothetical protein
MDSVLHFLHGGLAVMCVAIGVVFLRYWYSQRDRLFLWFMAAFWSFAVGWTVHFIFASTSSEATPHVYIFRLVGFALIAIAIIDKNRRSSSE